MGLAVLWNPSLPPELFYGVFTNVFVLIPIQFGYLYYLAKKRSNPGWSLKGIVVYTRPLSWISCLIWIPAILIPTAFIFVILETLTEWLEILSIGINIFSKYQMAATSDVVLIVFIAHIALSGILVPITEEFYFRGFLLPRMPIEFGRFKPVAHSFLFAVYHFDTPWMIPVRTIGILPLIFTTMHTRSVRPAIFAHCLVNLANFFDAASKRIGTP